MQWKIYAANDLQMAGSILLKTNRIFEFVSRSLNRVYLAVISFNNFERKLSYRLEEIKK